MLLKILTPYSCSKALSKKTKRIDQYSEIELLMKNNNNEI